MTRQQKVENEIRAIEERGGEYRFDRHSGMWWETGNEEAYHSDEIDPSAEEVIAHYRASGWEMGCENPAEEALYQWRAAAQAAADQLA